MKVRFSCLLTALALCACGGSPAPQPGTTADEVADEATGIIDPGHPPAASGTYAITLHRPTATGERFHFVGRGSEEVLSGLQGGEAHSQRLLVSLEGDVFVEAEEGGHATVSLVTITSFLAGASEASMAEQLPAGTVVRVQHGAAENRLTVDGQPMGEAAQKAFKLIVPTGGSELDLDATFGSSAPRSVGESWDIDGAAAAASLPDGFNVPEGGTSGRSTLSSVSEDEMSVAMEIAFQNPQMPNAPENSEVTESQMRLSTVQRLPLDVSERARGESYQMNLRVVMTTPDAPAPIEIVVQADHVIEFSPAS